MVDGFTIILDVMKNQYLMENLKAKTTIISTRLNMQKLSHTLTLYNIKLQYY